jgi:hypothetical protein
MRRLRLKQQVMAILAMATLASCRRAASETGSEPYDLHRCIGQRLAAAGFRTQSVGRNAIQGEASTVGSLNRMDGPVDRVHVWFMSNQFRAEGNTSVRDPEVTTGRSGWRVVSTSARVTRAIEDLYKSCPVPATVDTGGR